MTRAQHHALQTLLQTYAKLPDPEFHHGECVGSDSLAASTARNAGFKVIGHGALAQPDAFSACAGVRGGARWNDGAGPARSSSNARRWKELQQVLTGARQHRAAHRRYAG